MLELIGLDVGYTKPILCEIDLRVRRSHCAVFYGPNGIGKTTLLKTIATFLRPLKGEVLLDGYSVEKKRDRIFFLPETIDLPERIKALEYVRAVGSLYGNPDKLPARKALETVGLTEHDILIKNLSQGMKRKVQLAATLVVDADLYLLDDPVVAVADEEKEYLLGEVVRILRERGAVVVVTSRTRPNINASPVDLRKFSTFCLK